MATAKKSVAKKTTTTAKKKAPAKKTISTAKKSTTTKKVGTTTTKKKTNTAKKTTSTVKKTTTAKKTAPKKTTNKKSTAVKKTPVKKSATVKKTTTVKKSTPKKKTEVKKIVPVEVKVESFTVEPVKTEKVKQAKIKKEVENSFVFLSLFMGVAAMLLVVLHRFTFNIFGYEIMSSIFMLPILVLISNYITKKIGFDKSLKSILISMLMMAGIIILLDDLLRKNISSLDIAANLISFFVSMLINLSIYYYITTNIETKKSTYLVFLNYVFTIIVYQMVYMIFISKLAITSDFWMSYFIMIIIGGIISAVLSIFDKKIERGV